jgi:hypothetical protein
MQMLHASESRVAELAGVSEGLLQMPKVQQAIKQSLSEADLKIAMVSIVRIYLADNLFACFCGEHYACAFSRLCIPEHGLCFCVVFVPTCFAYYVSGLKHVSVSLQEIAKSLNQTTPLGTVPPEIAAEVK